MLEAIRQSHNASYERLRVTIRFVYLVVCKGTRQAVYHDQKPRKNKGLLIGRKCLACREGVARVEVRLVVREGNFVVKVDFVACWKSFPPQVWCMMMSKTFFGDVTDESPFVEGLRFELLFGFVILLLQDVVVSGGMLWKNVDVSVVVVLPLKNKKKTFRPKAGQGLDLRLDLLDCFVTRLYLVVDDDVMMVLNRVSLAFRP
nr:hypothetical protein [Tanacetum cinerariifolium]